MVHTDGLVVAEQYLQSVKEFRLLTPPVRNWEEAVRTADPSDQRDIPCHIMAYPIYKPGGKLATDSAWELSGHRSMGGQCKLVL